MALLRGNLHAHTTFSDGVLPPEGLIAEYETLGYDFLAITDHDDLITEGYWEAIAKLAPKLLLFSGVELSWAEFPQHVGRVKGDRETLHVLNHPARYRLSVREIPRRRSCSARHVWIDSSSSGASSTSSASEYRIGSIVLSSRIDVLS